jgi:anthranilate synthase component 1
MDSDYRKMIQDAEVGQIVPIVREIEIDCPVEFFSKLSDYGRREHCCLLESKDHLAEDKTGDLTFGTAEPSLYLSGKANDFNIKALNETGRRIIRYIEQAGRFGFAERVEFGEDVIKGSLGQVDEVIDEGSRLKSVNQMDVLRAVAFAFELVSHPFRVTCGLIGALSYDFIDQFEKLPANDSDILENPDYELYFADNMFLNDHRHGKCYVVVNVVVTDDDRDEIIAMAEECVKRYFALAGSAAPLSRGFDQGLVESGTDTNQAEYESMVQAAKGHILDGDIFQVVLSRTIMEPCRDEPLDVYRRLRKLNPSPYMFYISTPLTTLIGASPELNLRVSKTNVNGGSSGADGAGAGAGKRYVEIRPIAGTKPRGRVNGQIDPDTDIRYESELKLDRKELAEHMMLVDLARNDIARVASGGTRLVTELLIVERYESVMHLVSNVKGELRDDLDALSAYLATMNMGTLTGAPKIEAMKIIRQLEKNKRGYYGGAVMYLTVDGQFDSCITIRSLQIKDGTAYVRAGAGIVHDSVPKTEYQETQHKAASCLRAVRELDKSGSVKA